MILNILLVIQTIIWLLILMRASGALGYRSGLLKCIKIASLEDYNRYKITAFEWRFNTFNSVSFFKMVFVFWKSLMKVESWWDDPSFLEPSTFVVINERKATN